MTRLFQRIASGRAAFVLASLSLAAMLAACTDDAPLPTTPAPRAPSLTTGTFPVLTVTPSLTFGPQAVGTHSAAQDIVVSNTGSVDLHITGASEQGAEADFAAASLGQNLCDLNTPVPPGGSCRLPLEFWPKAEGLRADTITIMSDGGQGTVYATGTGVAAKPVLTVSATSLAFGSQLVGTTSGTQVVKVTNTGTAPLTLTDAQIVGANPGDFGGGSGTDWCYPNTPMAAGASCNLPIAFAPKAVGPRSAYLAITSDAGDGTVLLSGTGFSMPTADVSVSVAANPNPAQANKPLYYTIVVKNVGPDAATDVTLTNAIPSTTTYASVDVPSGVSCNTPAVGSTGAVTCSLGALPSGATRTIKLTVKVLSGGRNSIGNTAAVATTSADPVAGNNSATILTTVYGRK